MSTEFSVRRQDHSAAKVSTEPKIACHGLRLSSASHTKDAFTNSDTVKIPINAVSATNPISARAMWM
ncbi:MAG: hypothetical protein LBI69_01045 [Puniceicoccales bacterium]|nr:hypothetical protein [Puniceicoccales bacterium]